MRGTRRLERLRNLRSAGGLPRGAAQADLIWNDLLSSPDLSMGAWPLPSKRQLAHISASDHGAGAASRGTEGAACRARSPGRRARAVVLGRVDGRAATTTDARGRFDDESR